jgi:hypothetical protein
MISSKAKLLPLVCMNLSNNETHLTTILQKIAAETSKTPAGGGGLLNRY